MTRPTTHTRNFIRGIFVGAATLASIALTANSANAYSDSVKNACMSDYFAYCSAHDPESPKLRQCMRAVGPKLSVGCIAALVMSGEIAKTKTTRRSENVR